MGMHDVPNQEKTQAVPSPHWVAVRWRDSKVGLKDLFLERFGNPDPEILDFEDYLILL
jgi:hypothetical protein